ncbi:MAG: sigma factor-like helix-turn-helix DNA-binding protein [Singulisphaera sp.]
MAHRVAIRANVAASRRRAYERQAGQMAAAKSVSGPAVRDERLRALHEEIARLPEKLRLAILLCDLQGVPQDQAAGQLRLSGRTLRRRLSEGRERLKARLDRRGPASDGATLAALLLREGGMVVPPAWRETAVRAALAYSESMVATGVVSAAAATLSYEVLKTMMLQKLKLASAALLGVGFLTWGASAALIAPAENPSDDPRSTPVARPTERPARPNSIPTRSTRLACSRSMAAS